MPRVTFILSNGDSEEVSGSVKRVIPDYFEKNAVTLLQGVKIVRIEIDRTPIGEHVVEKLMDKFYKQYNVELTPPAKKEPRNEFREKCVTLRATLESWTEDLKSAEWPVDRDTGEQVPPKNIKNTFQQAVRLGIDVDSLLVEFVQALREDR